jgi:hypothetical protein
LIVILLSRVIIKLGSVVKITPKLIEGLYAADLAYLQGFYNQVNHDEKSNIKAVCPKCKHRFKISFPFPKPNG